MRKIDLIVIHCSATREDGCYTEYDLERDHRRRGFKGAGYHFYIRRDGKVVSTRSLERVGAHAKGYNQHSIGVCYEGGLDAQGQSKDTRTELQKRSLRIVVNGLLAEFPGSRVCGHRDVSPDVNGNGEIEPEEWIKECPCYEVRKEWKIKF